MASPETDRPARGRGQARELELQVCGREIVPEKIAIFQTLPRSDEGLSDVFRWRVGYSARP